MIRNIILDIGGVFFDDSKNNIEKLLNKNCDNIYKLAYGREFKKCLLGEISVQEHVNSLKGEEEFSDINYILKNIKRMEDNGYSFRSKEKLYGFSE